MKHSLLLVSTMVTLMTACGFHTQENKEIKPTPVTPQNQTVPRPQVNVGEAKIPADLINSIEAGSTNLRKSEAIKAGDVILAGMLASQAPQTEDEDSTLKVNSHLLVPMNPEISSVRTMDADELKIMDQAVGRKTYINIGCKDSQIDAQKIAGLQKALLEMHGTFKHAHADKIFLCGNDAMTMKNTVMYANEIIMNNASFVVSHGENGLINICARILTLEGQNRINSVTKNADGTLAPGAPIFLSVLDDVNGSGNLLINQ